MQIRPKCKEWKKSCKRRLHARPVESGRINIVCRIDRSDTSFPSSILRHRSNHNTMRLERNRLWRSRHGRANISSERSPSPTAGPADRVNKQRATRSMPMRSLFRHDFQHYSVHDVRTLSRPSSNHSKCTIQANGDCYTYSLVALSSHWFLSPTIPSSHTRPGCIPEPL